MEADQSISLSFSDSFNDLPAEIKDKLKMSNNHNFLDDKPSHNCIRWSQTPLFPLNHLFSKDDLEVPDFKDPQHSAFATSRKYCLKETRCLEMIEEDADLEESKTASKKQSFCAAEQFLSQNRKDSLSVFAIGNTQKNSLKMAIIESLKLDINSRKTSPKSQLWIQKKCLKEHDGLDIKLTIHKDETEIKDLIDLGCLKKCLSPQKTDGPKPFFEKLRIPIGWTRPDKSDDKCQANCHNVHIYQNNNFVINFQAETTKNQQSQNINQNLGKEPKNQKSTGKKIKREIIFANAFKKKKEESNLTTKRTQNKRFHTKIEKADFLGKSRNFIFPILSKKNQSETVFFNQKLSKSEILFQKLNRFVVNKNCRETQKKSDFNQNFQAEEKLLPTNYHVVEYANSVYFPELVSKTIKKERNILKKNAKSFSYRAQKNNADKTFLNSKFNKKSHFESISENHEICKTSGRVSEYRESYFDKTKERTTLMPRLSSCQKSNQNILELLIDQNKNPLKTVPDIFKGTFGGQNNEREKSKENASFKINKKMTQFLEKYKSGNLSGRKERSFSQSKFLSATNQFRGNSEKEKQQEYKNEDSNYKFILRLNQQKQEQLIPVIKRRTFVKSHKIYSTIPELKLLQGIKKCNSSKNIKNDFMKQMTEINESVFKKAKRLSDI